MSTTGHRRRALQRIAEHYAVEPDCSPYDPWGTTFAALGGEDAALRLLEACWRQVEATWPHQAGWRGWAWHRWSRPDIPWCADPVEEALALCAAGVLDDAELRAIVDNADGLPADHPTVRVVDALRWAGAQA